MGDNDSAVKSRAMKVLQTCEELTGDGGSIAVQRLYYGLKRAGIDSKVLCVIKSIESPDITKLEVSRVQRGLDRLLHNISSRAGLNRLLDVTSFKIAQLEAYQEADVLILNAPSYAVCSFLAYPMLTGTKPTLFPVKDMWSFTGHCYNSLDCDRWKTGCGNCPYPNVYPAIRKDNTRLEWKLKNWAYSRSNLNVLVPSTWMLMQVKQSMLNRFPVHVIPYGVDMGIYKPLDQEKCRSLLGIPHGNKVVMFLSANLDNRLKGGDLMVKAFRRLPESLRAETVVLLLGNRGEVIADSIGVRAINLGYVSSDQLKAICYSAADVFLHPTRADIFPYAVIESMACGTPIVSFKVGGVPDAVRPGITGYVAGPENVEEFSSYIVQVLEDDSLRNHMRQQCREIAFNEYSLDLQAQRHIDLCCKLLRPDRTV